MEKIFGFKYKKLEFNQKIINIKWLGKAAKIIEEQIYTDLFSYFPSNTVHRK
jgi:hypothetical protein